MYDGMQYEPIQKVKVKVTSISNFELLPFSKDFSSAIYNGMWQLTTDS